ncbi:MAG: NAD(+)/NADH kinase, partial [Defluviitaleaceae bacterium]|nr:NAD(+)/NADH kinase [Defluviitaleaceae bacterium]
DITVHRGQNPRLVHCHIDLNGEYMDDFRADGVVIATPTGSTAYSLSAGGPLLKPDAQMIAITPICPHSLSGRPAVVSHQDIITIKLENSPDLMIAYDGEYILKSKQKFIEITVQASEHTANIIRTCNLSFYELFRKKMT